MTSSDFSRYQDKTIEILLGFQKKASDTILSYIKSIPECGYLFDATVRCGSYFVESPREPTYTVQIHIIAKRYEFLGIGSIVFEIIKKCNELWHVDYTVEFQVKVSAKNQPWPNVFEVTFSTWSFKWLRASHPTPEDPDFRKQVEHLVTLLRTELPPRQYEH